MSPRGNSPQRLCAPALTTLERRGRAVGDAGRTHVPPRGKSGREGISVLHFLLVAEIVRASPAGQTSRLAGPQCPQS